VVLFFPQLVEVVGCEWWKWEWCYWRVLVKVIVHSSQSATSTSCEESLCWIMCKVL